MVSTILSDCVETVCSRWLAPSIACCLPHDAHQEGKEHEGKISPELRSNEFLC